MARCSFCGRPYSPLRYDQVTCGAERCKIGFKNLEQMRAKRLYRALYHWRMNRKGAHTADNLRFIAREIRDWIEEDREMQRPPPPEHAHEDDRGHQRRKLKALVV